MNFIKINWKLNNGSTASTYINEDKQELVMEELQKSTECWIDNSQGFTV